MFVTLPDIRLLDNTWQSVNVITGIPIGNYFKLKNKSNKPFFLYKNTLPPAPDEIDGVAVLDVLDNGLEYAVCSGSAEVWVKGIGAIISIDVANDPNPNGLYTGTRATTFQDYSEANKKNATQFAASKIITSTNTTTQFYSLLVLGDKPIDLKSREFAYTGLGIVADIFENPTYTITGAPDTVYSANGITPSNFDFLLYAGGAFTLLTTGQQFAPTIYGIGPTSQQSKGQPNGLYGSNYILAPNKSYLLRFSSRDPQSQEIAVRIEGYNGFLDLPITN